MVNGKIVICRWKVMKLNVKENNKNVQEFNLLYNAVGIL